MIGLQAWNNRASNRLLELIGRLQDYSALEIILLRFVPDVLTNSARTPQKPRRVHYNYRMNHPVAGSLSLAIDERYKALLHTIQQLPPKGSRPLTVSARRSEEHTSELQSLMRISYSVFCLKNTTSLTNSRATT